MDGPKTVPTQSDTVLTSENATPRRVLAAGPHRIGMAARKAHLAATDRRGTSHHLATANTITGVTALRQKRSAPGKAGTIVQP